MISFFKNKELRKRLSKYYKGVANSWKDKDDKLVIEANDDTMYCNTKRISKDGICLVNAANFIYFKVEGAQAFDPTKIMFFNKNNGKIEKVFPLEDVNARFFMSDIMVNNIIDKMMEDGNDDIVIGISDNIVKIAITSDVIAKETEKDNNILDILRKMPTFSSIYSVNNKKCLYYVSEHEIDNSKVQWFERGTFNAFTKAISDCIDFPIKNDRNESEDRKLSLSTMYGRFGNKDDSATVDVHKPHIREVLLVTEKFDAPDELLDFLKSIGYDSMESVYERYGYEVFDIRIINFIKNSNLLRVCNGSCVYFGKAFNKYRPKDRITIPYIGFGIMRLTTVDISKPWNIFIANNGIPQIEYVDYSITYNSYNKVTCTKTCIND